MFSLSAAARASAPRLRETSFAFIVFLAACVSGYAENINFTNQTTTITNAQGEPMKVDLIYGDLDGIIYQCPGGGGRLSYTNFSPAELESLGVPTNRIALAADRAAQRAELKKEEAARQAQRAAIALQQINEREQQAAAQQQAGTAKSPGNTNPGHPKPQKHNKPAPNPSASTGSY